MQTVAILSEKLTPEQIEEREMLLNRLENAPPEPGTIAPDLRGWWTPLGWYLCARCAGRVMARGCCLPSGSAPVWADKAEPFGLCIGCEPGEERGYFD